MVCLQPVTQQNFEELVALHVAPEQQKLVATNIRSLAQAYVQPNCYPFGIYANDVPVGFLMYCLDAEDDEYWLYRLMVDENHQRKGYGEAAVRLLLAIIKQDNTRHKLYLGVDIDGSAAPALYQKMGFRFNGRVYDGEHIMLLNY